jgi:glycosyltransferase involved in cell wall biosynthesis
VKVSGFTFVRDAIDQYYPVVESITSVLPICDEFLVAAGDSSDGTTELIRSIGDPKIKIIETVWDPAYYKQGDWAFYVQADEVLHEDDLPRIGDCMRRWRNDRRVEGLLFDYIHFFADYDHYMTSHGWYRREVRIVRTGVGVRSWRGAQSFRRGDQKIKVRPTGARIFHYGWVRPPRQMTRKSHTLVTLHAGAQVADRAYPDKDGRARFTSTHPAIMRARIAAKDWEVRPSVRIERHDRLGIRLLSFLENRILGFRLGEHRNYVVLPEQAGDGGQTEASKPISDADQECI